RRRSARSREDLVELFQRGFVERELERAQRRVELLDGARADDGASHHRVLQQPRERHVGGRLAELGTQRLVFLESVAMLGDRFLRELADATPLGLLLERAAEHAAL